ncbi:MAG: PAS domain S-box protein [Acidobacteriota bacterium]|nr:PAS domain S-box protein [Acidobacteriota bacterium]
MTSTRAHNLSYYFWLPAFCLVLPGAAAAWYWSWQTTASHLEDEILDAGAFRADLAAVTFKERIADLGLNLEKQADDPNLQAWLTGEVEQSANSPENSWSFWLAHGEDGRELDMGLPVDKEAMRTLFQGETRRSAARIMKSDDGSGRDYWVHAVKVMNPENRQLGVLYQGLSLQDRESLMVQLRARSGSPTMAVLNAGSPVGVSPEHSELVNGIVAELQHGGDGPILDGNAFGLIQELVPENGISLLTVMDNTRLETARRAHHQLGLMIVLPLIFAVFLAGFLFRKRLAGSFEHLLGYTEKTGLSDVAPEYATSGLTELDEIGRAIGRVAEDVQVRRRQLAELAENEKEQAKNLRNREEQLARIVDNLPEGVTVVDLNGKITLMNYMAEQMTGWQRHEAGGRKAEKVVNLIHPQTRQPLANPILAALKLRKVQTIGNQVLLITRDGVEHQVEGTAGPLMENHKLVGAVLIFRDITEQYFLQHQQQQNQKMEAIGQLAGGIAHDFNNLLSAIIGYAELLQQDLRDPEPISKEELVTSVEHIVKVARQGADLTGQLQAFSRQGKMQAETVNLHDTIVQVLKMAERTFDAQITIVKNLEAERVHVKGDPSQLENALLNLALNAREAMPDGGKLTVSTAVVILDESFCLRQKDPIEPGEYLELSIGDTGVGMSQDIMQKIFEPFYTTKPAGKGSGLGLAAVYGTVTGHQGLITVYSEPEFGTVFKIHLPLAAEKEPEKKPEEEHQEELITGEGLILLVEDENVVREIALTMLKQFGYGVIEATNGKEGLDKYREFRDEIDLVILDMEMPVMGGREALIKLKEIDPNVRILIASGYSLDLESRDFFEKGGVSGFIQKPYLMADFSKIIAEILSDKYPALD